MALIDEKKLRGPLSRAAVLLRSMIRRMTVTTSADSLWSVAGHDDEDDSAIPVFSGIGFHSRPASDGDPEVIVLKVGGKSAHPVIVATRDERVRQAVSAADLAEDETIIFNAAGGYVHIRASGNVDVEGTAVKLGASAVDAVVKGTTYRTAEDVMLTALAAALTALSTDPVLAGSTKTACSTAATAITTFQASASSYLSTKSKTE